MGRIFYIMLFFLTRVKYCFYLDESIEAWEKTQQSYYNASLHL